MKLREFCELTVILLAIASVCASIAYAIERLAKYEQSIKENAIQCEKKGGVFISREGICVKELK